MLEIQGDLFAQECDAICITTNGYVDRKGMNVMGAGVAGEAARRWPFLKGLLGLKISELGNKVHLLMLPDTGSAPFGVHMSGYAVVSFPTKTDIVSEVEDVLPRYRHELEIAQEMNPEATVPGWMGKSDLALIALSAQEMVKLANEEGWSRVCLTRPGCGLGGLNWEKQVRPVLQQWFDDRFVIISR